MGERKPPPLSSMLRGKAVAIEKLQREYEELRYGDEIWRFGDKEWRESKTQVKWTCEKCGTEAKPEKGAEFAICSKCENLVLPEKVRLGIPPRFAGTPPQITVISSPRNIYYEEEVTDEEEEQSEQVENEEQQPEKSEKEELVAFNPLAKAAINLGEITPEQAHKMALDTRYNTLVDLGVDERRHCVALIPWLRKLAGNLTYILETREIYSADIKAVYPELLTNLEIAIGTCDQLAHLLGKQGGTLTRRQFDELLVKLLHYTEIARQAALQLADHHEEFLGAEVSPLEPTAEVEWVLEEEKKFPLKELEEKEEEKTKKVKEEE